MSGFEMRAQFYPLVTDLERLKEEAAEGVPYPFLAEEMLELSLKDYRKFCSALGQRYAFETDIPKEGYDMPMNCSTRLRASLMIRASSRRFVNKKRIIIEKSRRPRRKSRQPSTSNNAMRMKC